MTDMRLVHQRTAELFGRHVHAVADDQWHLPTPDTEWDVRDLVNHLVSEHRWVPPLLAGQTIDEVGDRFDGDLLGEDPKAAWDEATAEALAAFAEEGAMQRTVHLSFGDVPAEEYAFELASDLLVHGWDLARAIGADERLDPDLVELVYQGWKPREAELRHSGLFAPPPEIPPDSDRQTQLLALFGRRA